MPAIDDVPLVALTSAVALLAAAAAWLLLRALTIFPGKPGRYARRFRSTCARAYVAFVMSLAALLAWSSSSTETEPLAETVEHLLVIAVIAATAWLAIRVIDLVERFVLRRLHVDTEDNRRMRRLQTQVTLLKRVTDVVILVVTAAAILMTFEELRTFGASLLASAGLAGVVAGLAAQTTLGNVFAGIQLAATDAVRIDDVVVVEGEWGRVEELTLTYVVIHLWDERRLVLPTTHFTTTPFQNWTRKEARVLGSVVLHLDFRTPVEALRAHAQQVIAADPRWDGRDWALQVVDSTDRAMVVRVLASAHDAPTAWNLRCDIREELLRWLQAEHPQSLPRLRTQLEDVLAERADEAEPADPRELAMHGD